MKYVYWALSLIFLLFVLVQYNDPDPISWMLLYGSICLNAGLLALQKPIRPLLWLSLLASLVWAATLIPAFMDWFAKGMPSIVQTMKAETPWVELTREFLGLLLAAAAAGWMLQKSKTR